MQAVLADETENAPTYQQEESAAPYIVMITEEAKEQEMIAAMPEGVNTMLLMDSGSCVHACPRVRSMARTRWTGHEDLSHDG